MPRNMAVNPSFEVSTAGWSTAAFPVSRVAGTWGCGSWVGRFQITATGTQGLARYGPTVNQILCNPGDTVFAQISLKAGNAAADGNRVLMRIEFCDAAGSTLQTNLGPELNISQSFPVTAYVFPYPSVAAPPNTHHVIITLINNAADSVAGDLVEADCLDVRINEPVPSEYRDGNSPDWMWVGTPGLSESIYAPADPAARPQAWRTGSVKVEGMLWKADKDGNLLEDLSDRIVRGKVNWNADRGPGVKLQGDFQLDQRGLVEPYIDFVAPVLRLTWGDNVVEEQQFGLHLVDWPEDLIYQHHGWQSFKGIDPTWFAYNVVLRDTVNYASSDVVPAKMALLMATAGYDRISFPASTRTFGAAKSIFPPKRIYDAAAEQFEAMNWLYPYSDLDGTITSGPYIDLGAVTPAITVTMDDPVGEWKVVPTTTVLANVVSVYKENGASGGAPILYTAENADPASRISTVYRPEILREITNAEIKTQAEAQALAEQTLAEASSYYRVIQGKLSPSTWMRPYSVMDCYLEDPVWGSLAGRYHVRDWTVGFTQSEAEVSVEANRWINFDEGGM